MKNIYRAAALSPVALNCEALSSCGRPADRLTVPTRSGNLPFHPAPTFGSYVEGRLWGALC
jgi:hypothetical protein